MIDTVVVAPTPGGTSTSTLAGLSWPSIVAGAVVACALTIVLLAFGTGLGLTMVSPWSGSGVSATTFKITTGLYLIVIAMLASSIGGYIAGRLRSSWTDVHRDEIYFRDTAHGFIAWALATVLGATALAIPATSLIGGSAVGASQAAANAAQTNGPMDGYVDTLLRSDPAAAGPTGTASGGTTNATDSHGEMVRLFTRSFRNGGDLKGPDREYAAKVVASRTGMSQADADKRVNDVVTQVKADADAARKATASLAFWLTAAMLLGAFCASLAATEGGGLRDGTWNSRRR
ncbi:MULTISPECIES: hypothetical protein [Bradyrhizobium]|uniref:Transmembrane protein n=1 Tax=Bradyrhizobium ottawaense TaxID=931866 RepID=A0ABV4FM33_9BRAD|nr:MULTISPECIES: hypothetical protein [Bradyrhizobium]MBR1294771.1 hypothetical protein [Bradyrhizobium ottawaense]PDT64216.1 hypothetical protein CO683_39620 [Bradyrhizobium ottawaense]WLB44724.1 hypothetical protein QIH93_29980 [Bradyrhizobium ottawaense]WQN82022.1 hypothetical protein U7859_34445 [Bradyrhizobium ottawaense]BBO03357.1 hypothetical protein SG09_27070 [Bradyrhizobium ottawaense]